MREDLEGSTSWRRGWVVAAIAVLGCVAIVGSGGGGGPVSIDGCFIAPCPGDFPAEPATPTIEPPVLTVQVGATTAFTARAPGIDSPTYQWWRAPRGGAFVSIPGATGSTYTPVNAQLVDDGAAFMVEVHGGFNRTQVVLNSVHARLAVSSMPGIVFQDGEFAAADWAATAVVEPATNGPTHGEVQVASGGHPGAYRQMNLALTTGPSKLDVFNLYQPAVYDPATQGAVYLIEFSQDCIQLPGVLGGGPTLLIEQDGRRFIAGSFASCTALAWSTAPYPITFDTNAFLQISGPACDTGASCPDFSGSGKPIHVGYSSSNNMLAGIAGVSGGFGIDNWKVTVWRR